MLKAFSGDGPQMPSGHSMMLPIQGGAALPQTTTAKLMTSITWSQLLQFLFSSMMNMFPVFLGNTESISIARATLLKGLVATRVTYKTPGPQLSSFLLTGSEEGRAGDASETA